MRSYLPILCAAIGLLPASAATIHDNGAPNLAGASQMIEYLQADDFTLGAQYSLTGVRFWSLEGSGIYSGSIDWSIRQNNGGLPDAIVTSGTVSPTRVDSGPALGLTLFQNDFSIGPVNVAAGTYWLVLNTTSAGQFPDFYWANSSTGAGLVGQEYELAGPGPWNPTFEQSFQIFGDRVVDQPVPEPGTWALLAGGLITLAAARRKKSVS
ncbi:MAG: PEP-CTERM sorting domain-containing protein [Acidobacteria bacterium]|nr:PEP-CTERM sorting domain-containing protein [Acidobacteriota bacterium]